MNRRWTFSLSLVIVVAAVASVIAQTPATSTEPAATTGTAVTGTSVQQTLQEILEEPTGDTYRYDPQGRRDPFRSLVGPAPTRERRDLQGVAGFLIDEIKLTGIVRTKQGIVGVIAGPDNKGYLLRIGDKILDGEVVRITPSSVVFRQEVNDPTRIERFREVVKDLTPPSEKR